MKRLNIEQSKFPWAVAASMVRRGNAIPGEGFIPHPFPGKTPLRWVVLGFEMNIALNQYYWHLLYEGKPSSQAISVMEKSRIRYPQTNFGIFDKEQVFFLGRVGMGTFSRCIGHIMRVESLYKEYIANDLMTYLQPFMRIA